MTESLQDIEERMGFKFGVSDDFVAGPGRILKHLQCHTVGCERSQTAAIPIFDDTVQPVFCGSCGEVLHCDHEPDKLQEHVGGTLSEPTLTLRTECRKCRTVMDEQTTALEPVRFKDLPAHALAALGVPFARVDGS